jgi:hypothetical protein
VNSARAVDDVQRFLIEDCAALLEVHGVELESAEASPPPTLPLSIASIGFSGVDATGAISIAATTAVWGKLAPPELGLSAEEAIALGAPGEFANLTLGRLRNRLLRLGVDLRSGVPTTHACDDAALGDATRRQWQRLATSAGQLFIRLDIVVTEHFSLAAFATLGLEANEAELLLF